MTSTRSALSLLSVAALLAGCSGLGDVPSGRKIGIFRMTHTPVDDHVSTTTFGEFFQDHGETSGLPNAKTPIDTCDNPVPFSDIPTPPAVLAFLNPGDTVRMTSSGSPQWSDFLRPVLDTVSAGVVITYNLAHGDTVPYAPHTLINFAVPGATNGMAAGTLSQLLAEPIAFTSAIDTAPHDSLHVLWNAAAPGDSSAVDLALIYDLNGGKPQEVFCVLIDDGDKWVQSFALTGWRKSNSHLARITRFRTTYIPTNDQLLFGLSEYTAQKTTFP